MTEALQRHDAILHSAIDAHDGYVFSTGGDGYAVAFARAGQAVAAAVEAQAALGVEPWPTGARLRVRMAIHTGEAEERDGDYFGTVVNRAARLMAVGHGGQVLCSAATADVVADAEWGLVDLGDHRLRDLDRAVRVFQVGRGAFPPLRSMEAFPGNLRTQASSFVGRDEELAEATEVLAASRLVTLTGVGGVGKTRLALQLAAEQLARFPDGVWFCDLASVLDGQAVSGAVAATLGLQPAPGEDPGQSVARFAAGRRVLVVLDNCEHLLDGAAALVDLLLHDAAPARVVATSREALGVAGERVLAVRPLGVPADGDGVTAAASDAVQLFVSRAAEARPGFVLTDENAAAVVSVCRRLDGIPLALELAAARIASMGPSEVAERLDQRFRLLTRGSRTARARHQTLRAAIDWSFDALDPVAQRGLASCAVFAGGFSLGAAEAVLADDSLDPLDAADVLDELVRRSLVVVEQSGSATRYRLLETIRQYADEHLDAQQAERRRAHALWYAAFADQAGAGQRSAEAGNWRERLEPELENLRLAVMTGGESGAPATAMRIVGAFPDWAYYTRPTFGRVIASLSVPALAVAGADQHPARSAVTAAAALHALFGGDIDRAWDLALHAADLASRDQKRPPIGAVLAIAANSGRLAEVERIIDLDPRSYTDPEDQAVAQSFRAMLRAMLLADDAVEEARKAVEIADSTGVHSARAAAYWALGVALSVDDPSGAAGALQTAMDLCRVSRDDFLLTHASNRLARVTLALDPAQAARLFHARLDEAQRIGGATQVDMWLMLAAFLLARAGHANVAATVLGALTDSIFLLNPITARDHQQAEAHCRDVLGEKEYDACYSAGRQAGTAQAFQRALTALSSVATES